MSPRRLSAALVLALVFALDLASAASGSLDGPELHTQRAQGTTRVWVEAQQPGGPRTRRLLRETSDPVSPVASGRDPSARAAFVTWSESGDGRWFSYSRDWGRSWSAPRPLETALRLRDGATRPGEDVPRPAPGYVLPRAAGLYLVQFRVISLPEWREAVEARGAKLLRPFPHNAHIVRADSTVASQLKQLEFVERVEPYHPWYRIGPRLRDWLAGTADASAAQLRVRVMTFEWGPEAKARIADEARKIGAREAAIWPSGHVLELWVGREQLPAIAALDDVLWIDRWSAPESDMNLVREDAGADWLETNLGFCGQGVRGEVLDSGIEPDHGDFDGLLLHGPQDVTAHGTATYGIVFGNGDGNNLATGLLPCAQGIFADYHFMTDRFAHAQELKQSPYFASFQSNSWGNGLATNYNSFSAELDDIIWRLDIAITQSQGNESTQQSRPQAWGKNVISVGGIQHDNSLGTSDDSWSNDASIGPAADGRIKPDLHYWNDDIRTTDLNDRHTNKFGGTSAATPQVAGVLGLMAQMWSENVWGTQPVGQTVFERQPHASTLKALLINNAQQYAFSSPGDDLSRHKQGWGRPSVQIAAERAAQSLIVDETVPLAVGELAAFDVDVLAGETALKVTMVYPDPPGTTAATLHRINDLDLRVISPAGTLYHGNVGLDTGNWSQAGGSPNAVDTVENVFVANPQVGTWRVEVEASEINQDALLVTPEADAAFALVVTGATGDVCPAPLTDFTIAPNPTQLTVPVQFQSTVSGGGGGGPYTYRWDFDGDGVPDSTAADPTYVYNRPFNGDVTLQVRDTGNCPSDAQRAIAVSGPDVRFHDAVNLTELQGNGNAGLDPGEIWEVEVRLRNDGTDTAVGVTAQLAPSVASPGTVTMLQDTAAFGDLAQGAVATGQSPYRFEVGAAVSCGARILFDVEQIRSVVPDNVFPDETQAQEIAVTGIGQVPIHTDSFETDTGWTVTGDGEWEFDVPSGLGGPPADPTSAVEGSRVLGNDVTGLGAEDGNYESGVFTSILSPPIDASGATDVALRLSRWLNVAPGDQAFLGVQEGVSGIPAELFFVIDGHSEQAWSQLEYDVSEVADGSADFFVVLALLTDGSNNAAGWNLDDLALVGVTQASCALFSLPGELSDLSVLRSSGSLRLSWQGDCGSGTAYSIYRGNLISGYGSASPEPGFCDHPDTTALLPEGAGAAEFFLVAPSDGGFDGGYGRDSAGNARPPLAGPCHPQGVPHACVPGS